MSRPRPTRAAPTVLPETRLTQVTKAMVMTTGVLVWLWAIATPAGYTAACVGTLLGAYAASRSTRAGLRLTATVAIAAGAGAVGWWIGDLCLQVETLSALLGPRMSISLSDVLVFGGLTFSGVWMSRALALRYRVFAAFEALALVTGIAWLFIEHRHYRLNEPRFFSDWAWSAGRNPTELLVVIGAAAAITATILLIRRQRLGKLMATFAVLLLLVVPVIHVAGTTRLDMAPDTNGLGLSGKGGEGSGQEASGRGGKGEGEGRAQSQRGEGGSSGQGGGQGKGPFRDDYGSGQQPTPVAVVIFHDDYEPEEQVLYFRQQALSRYDNHHLAVDTAGRFDTDVIRRFPVDLPLRGAGTQTPAHHIEVPTSVYLMVDHPQPIALTHAATIAPLSNPDPRQFVAAYEVQSLTPAVTSRRLVGRQTLPPAWTAAERDHYLTIPDDPRYGALADELVREVDPRFVHDPLMTAMAIKRYLEREGYYTRKTTHVSASDPTASFLFGSLRGYCVHFAHAAVYLFRSQGIAARVALGYAVPTNKLGGGSALLVMSHQAHAWPEIYLAGVGWIPFDIYPEQSDEPPAPAVDADLAHLLGELARKDRTAGVGADPSRRPFEMPWAWLWTALLTLLGVLLLGAYGIKLWRRLLAPRGVGPHAPRRLYRATMDRLSDVGASRRHGESREAHAQRVSALAPSLSPLTQMHLGLTLGSRREAGTSQALPHMRTLSEAIRHELTQNVPSTRRWLGHLNPVGWLATR